MGPYVLSKTECCAGFSIQPSMAGRCFQYFNDGTYRQTIDGEYMGITVYFSVPDNDTPGRDSRFLYCNSVFFAYESFPRHLSVL